MAKRRRVEKEKEVGVEMEVEEDRLKGMPSGRPTPEGNAQIHPKEMGMRSSKQPNKRRRAETEMGVEVEVKEDRLGKKSTKHPRKRKNLEREGEVQQKDLEVVEDRYLYPREFRKTTVHVSNYSSLHTLRDVRDSLSPSELALVRKTAIGHLLDVSDEQRWCAAVYYYLMSRLIRVEPEKTLKGEVWFSVRGRDLCFCKEDYEAITGLSFKQSGEAIDSKKVVLNLMQKHFGSDTIVTGRNLYDFLAYTCTKNERSKTFGEKEAVECPDGDRVKVALLLIVHVFLFGRQLKDQVDKEHWALVENLENFNTFPWGAKSYALLFEKTQIAFARQGDKKMPPKLCSLKPGGMPQALVVWMLKVFPDLLCKYGMELASKRPRPLLLTVVLCKHLIEYKVFCKDMKGVVFSEDNFRKIRAVGEEFREAVWEEGVFETHDLEDASAGAPHDDQDQDIDSTDDNKHFNPAVPEQSGVEVTAGDAERGSHLGVGVSAEMAIWRKEVLNSVKLMIDGFSEKMTRSLNSLEHRIESVESMVHQLLETIGAPPGIHTDGGLESARPNKESDSCNDEAKEDETMDEILSDKVEEEDGRPVVMNHAGDSFDDSALNEKDDSDGVKADVQGPRPDTADIRQHDPVEVIQKDKGEDIDVEIEKEDMLKNKVSSEDEDADADTSLRRRYDPVEDKGLSEQEDVDVEIDMEEMLAGTGLSEKEDVDMEEMLADTGLSEEEATDTGVVVDSIPENVREDHTGKSSVDNRNFPEPITDVEDPITETSQNRKFDLLVEMIDKYMNHQDINVEENGDRVVVMENGAKPDKEYVLEEVNDEMLKVQDLSEEEDHTGKSLVDNNCFDTVKVNVEYPRTETAHTPRDDQKNVQDIVISEERDADTGSVIDSMTEEVREVTLNEQDPITETDLSRQDCTVKNMVGNIVLFEDDGRVFKANAEECTTNRHDDTEEVVDEEAENAEMVTNEDLSEEEDHTGERLIDNKGFDPVKSNVEDPTTETAHNPQDDQKNVNDIVLSEDRDADAEILTESSAETDEDHGEADSLVDDSPLNKDVYITPPVKTRGTLENLPPNVADSDDSVVRPGIKIKSLSEIETPELVVNVPIVNKQNEQHKKCAGKKTKKGVASESDHFENFRSPLLITSDDINRLKNFLITDTDAGLSRLTCADFKKLLDENGMLECVHINGMLALMRRYAHSTGGKWTTIDTYFETYTRSKPEINDKIEEYRSGTLPKPKGTGKPWKDAETVYGVVHLKDETHWVAIRLLLKQQIIVIYDSLRPRGDTERFPEEVRNICTALLDRTDHGDWHMEFHENFPQQDSESVSCGVYALKAIDCLIRGVELSSISASGILQYRREMAVQLYIQKFVELPSNFETKQILENFEEGKSCSKEEPSEGKIPSGEQVVCDNDKLVEDIPNRMPETSSQDMGTLPKKQKTKKDRELEKLGATAYMNNRLYGRGQRNKK